MNDCFVGKQQRRGGAGLGTSAEAAPAQPHYTVGEVGFGPGWQDDDDGWVQLTEKGWRAVTDNMAASIVRLEQELEEANARIAVLEEEQKILAKGFPSPAKAAVIEGGTGGYPGAERPEPSPHFKDDDFESIADKEAADRIGGNKWSAW